MAVLMEQRGGIPSRSGRERKCNVGDSKQQQMDCWGEGGDRSFQKVHAKEMAAEQEK